MSKRSFVILEIPAHSKPIRLLLDYEYTFKDKEGYRYFFEEHTCPTNWTKSIAEIVIGEDEDPHGFARFITAYEKGTPEFEKLAEVCDSMSNMNWPEGWTDLVNVKSEEEQYWDRELALLNVPLKEQQ